MSDSEVAELIDGGENFIAKEEINNNESPTANSDTINKPSDVTMADLNSSFNTYATRKTITGGLFNLSLMTANFTQLKDIVTAKPPDWNGVNIVLVVFICISLTLQVIVACLFLYIGRKSNVINDKNEFIKQSANDWALLIVFVITVVNIFITVFTNTK